jgi:hypothetical protein
MKKKAAEDLKRWCDLLVVIQPTEQVPDGWLTTMQICEQLNQSRSYVARRLGERMKDGSCEMKTFRIRTGSIVRPVPHYRIK